MTVNIWASYRRMHAMWGRVPVVTQMWDVQNTHTYKHSDYACRLARKRLDFVPTLVLWEPHAETIATWNSHPCMTNDHPYKNATNLSYKVSDMWNVKQLNKTITTTTTTKRTLCMCAWVGGRKINVMECRVTEWVGSIHYSAECDTGEILPSPCSGREQISLLVCSHNTLA